MNFRVLIGVAAVAASTASQAGPAFDYIRVGDRDGFGFSSTAGLVRATGAPHSTAADTNNNNLLEQTEYLPDINKNGSVATGSGDDWDNRSATEKSNSAALGGNGFADKGSSGSKWTDITLSTSFTGPEFPDPSGPAAPNQPVFLYSFSVDASAVVTTTQLFFNLVFGDYDVSPANVTLEFASAASRTVALTLQPGSGDGLIQAATATLDFNEVFTANGSGGYDGYLKATFEAPNEPYTAFDYTELSVTQIAFNAAPAPATLPLVALAMAALAASRRRRAR